MKLNAVLISLTILLATFANGCWVEKLLLDLNQEPRNAELISVGEDWCFVIEGKASRSCIERERIFNLTESFFGQRAILSEVPSEQELLDQWFRIQKVTNLRDEEGVVLSVLLTAPIPESDESDSLCPPICPPPPPFH